MTAPICTDEAATRAHLQTLISEFFEGGTGRAAGYGSHFQKLWQIAGRSVAGGKLMRPLLLMNCHDALSSDPDSRHHGHHTGSDPISNDPVPNLAVAVELLHYSFLLHDDVIDGDLLRRGRPNLIGSMVNDDATADHDVARVMHWAQTCGILMGDLLLSASHQIFARAAVPEPQRIRLLDLLDETIEDSIAGEQIDVGLSDAIISPELHTILDMTARKTATYSFELPMRMAAVLAGAPRCVEDRMGTIGRHLGLGFQLQDDLLGAFGDPAAHGKDHFSDLREGKQTAIIAAARSTPAWPDIEGLLEMAVLSQHEAARLSAMLAECGAQDRVADLAEQELRSATMLIDTSGEDLPRPVRTVLVDLIEKLRGRSS